MKQFFSPASIAVFGVSAGPANLAKNIIHNCLNMGFKGDIFPIGKRPGTVFGKGVLTDPDCLSDGIDFTGCGLICQRCCETQAGETQAEG